MFRVCRARSRTWTATRCRTRCCASWRTRCPVRAMRWWSACWTRARSRSCARAASLARRSARRCGARPLVSCWAVERRACNPHPGFGLRALCHGLPVRRHAFCLGGDIRCTVPRPLQPGLLLFRSPSFPITNVGYAVLGATVGGLGQGCDCMQRLCHCSKLSSTQAALSCRCCKGWTLCTSGARHA